MDRHARNSYGKRNRLLKLLAFASYGDYLLSPLWGRIRAACLIEQSWCYACGNRSVQVHHGSYSLAVLRGAEKRHLYAVCIRCHRECEFSGEGGIKAGTAAATAWLKAKRKARLEGGKHPRLRRSEQEILDQEKRWARDFRSLILDDEPVDAADKITVE